MFADHAYICPGAGIEPSVVRLLRLNRPLYRHSTEVFNSF